MAQAHREYCPNCGEPVNRGLTIAKNSAPCDNCETGVVPIDDPDDAAMPFKALHPIRCRKCKERPQLVGLHMGEYTDGVVVACDCHSADCIPYELGESELPDQWEIMHDAVVFDR